MIKKKEINAKASKDLKNISKGLEYQINQEFSTLWLKKRNNN